MFCNELLEVIQYTPKTPDVHAIPLVYVFSQVNRFYLGDLTPDRSLFQKLLDAGHPGIRGQLAQPDANNNATGDSIRTPKASFRPSRSRAKSAASRR